MVEENNGRPLSAFAKRLNALKENTGWPNTKLANDFGVTAMTLSSWLSGKSQPQKKNRWRMGKILKDLEASSKPVAGVDLASGPDSTVTVTIGSTEPSADPQTVTQAPSTSTTTQEAPLEESKQEKAPATTVRPLRSDDRKWEIG